MLHLVIPLSAFSISIKAASPINLCLYVLVSLVCFFVRACLFPNDQSRRVKQIATPPVAFEAVMGGIVASLANEWRLPTMSDCLAHL